MASDKHVAFQDKEDYMVAVFCAAGWDSGDEDRADEHHLNRLINSAWYESERTGTLPPTPSELVAKCNKYTKSTH
jgi:hypothetical protein